MPTLLQRDDRTELRHDGVGCRRLRYHPHAVVDVSEPFPARVDSVRRALRSPVLLTTAAVVVPIVVTIIAISGRPWFATGDYAHTELLVRAIPDHPPLVGVAARVGGAGGQGSTPGPSMTYLLDAPYRCLLYTSPSPRD